MMWHPIAVKCHKCDLCVSINSIQFDAEGKIKVEGECPKGHGETTLISSWEEMVLLCYNLDQQAGEEPVKRRAN